MNEKSLLTMLCETLDEYRAQQRRAKPQGEQMGRLRHLLRWLTPNGGTLLLIAALILTQNAWARPAASPATALVPSAGDDGDSAESKG